MTANSHRKMVLMFKLLRLGFLTAVITATVAATTVNSHSGGLNSQGCHAGSRPYHCHRSSSEMVPSTSGGYRLRCGAGSRSKDCRRSPVPRYDIKTIIDVQYLLVTHCRSLQPSFIDGAWGRQSQAALKRFQSAYGLKADGIIGRRTITALNGPVTGRCR